MRRPSAVGNIHSGAAIERSDRIPRQESVNGRKFLLVSRAPTYEFQRTCTQGFGKQPTYLIVAVLPRGTSLPTEKGIRLPVRADIRRAGRAKAVCVFQLLAPVLTDPSTCPKSESAMARRFLGHLYGQVHLDHSALIDTFPELSKDTLPLSCGDGRGTDAPKYSVRG